MEPQARRPQALGVGAASGVLGGLIGLGGGEFRLPVLVGFFGIAPRSAVPLNLLVSLVTLSAGLAIRAGTLSLAPVGQHVVETVGLGIGGVIGATWSARLLTRLSDHHLERAVASLLALIGCVLIVEAALPADPVGFVPRVSAVLLTSGLAIGVVIGVVAALLGVAGGELLIPTLLLVYGADIRTSGSASLMISLVTVSSGLLRYARLGALPDGASIRNVAAPMGLGSIVGAIVGGLLVGVVPAPVLKVVLGLVLIAAALKGLRR